MFHSPVGNETNDTTYMPSAKLGAVTRKRHETEELLHDVPNNLPLIQNLFAQYLAKVEALREACTTPANQEWLESHIVSIEAFRARVDSVIARFTTPRDHFERWSNNSKSSRRTSSSTSSRARLRVAEEKATLMAERASLEERAQLAEREANLKASFERELLTITKAKKVAELNEKENKVILLENELERLDIDNASRGDLESLLGGSNKKLQTSSQPFLADDKPPEVQIPDLQLSEVQNLKVKMPKAQVPNVRIPLAYTAQVRTAKAHEPSPPPMKSSNGF